MQMLIPHSYVQMYSNKAMSLSDCDATNFELEQAVLESSLESYRNQEHGRKQASSSGAAGGSRGRHEPIPSEKFASRATSSSTSNYAEARDAAPMSVS